MRILDPPKPLAMLAVLALLALPALPAVAARVQIPGSRISLEPPAGFTLADRFPGFADPSSGASILVTEMPAPLAEARQGMTVEMMAPRGMKLLGSETVSLDGGGEATLLDVEQTAGGRVARKWMAVFGDETQTTTVIATYPPDRAATLAAPLRQAVLSARRSATAPDPLAGLPFTVAGSGPLQVAQRVANALLLTRDGKPGVAAPGEPVLVVAASLSAADLTDLQTFAGQRLQQTEQLTGPWQTESRAVEVGGLAGWELEGEATAKRDGKRLKVYQLILRDGPRQYLIAQAMVRPEEWEAFLPHFRAVAHSLRKRGE